MPPWRESNFSVSTNDNPELVTHIGIFLSFYLTLLRARGAASGVLGDVDSLAVSDVELKEELLLDNSLLDGRFVANCQTGDAVKMSF